MATDCAAIGIAFCLFSFVSVIPGYAMGWLLDTLRFRTRTIWCRLAISVPLSISLGPVISYFVGRWLSTNAAVVMYAALCLYALFLFARGFKSSSRRSGRISGTHLKVLAIVFAWIVIAGLSLTDLQIGHRLYFSIISFDYCVRTAFTNAISTFGLPAQNPFFFPGHPVGLRYHYFWLILPALVHQVSRSLIDPRQAFVGGTIWCGIGLICIIGLYLRFFSPKGALDISRRTLIGVLLLGVTGLDILPTLLMLWLAHKGVLTTVSPSVEWWNEQIDGWLYTMLWEPHYLSGVIACLTGFLIIWDAARESSRTRRMVSGIAAAVAFATSVGAAIYVAFVFAIFLLSWTAITVWKKWYRETALLAIAGILAFALSVPFLISLRAPGSGGALLKVTIRSFPLGDAFLVTWGFNRPWEFLICHAVCLPANYFLELGFFFVAGRIVWQRFREEKRVLSRNELASLTMIIATATVCTFVRSGVIASNDLGWRGFLIAQFMLLILAADLWSIKASGSGLASDRPLLPRHKSLLTALLIVGAIGVVYDLAMLRFFPLLSDAGAVPKIAWLANDEKLGSRTYANREAYEWLRANSPLYATIQQNPQVAIQDTMYGLYGNRRTIAADTFCGTYFGGDPQQCGPIFRRLTPLFSAGDGSSATSFQLACQSLPIDFLVAKDTDGTWNDRNSWIWTRTPIFANDFVRLFACPRLMKAQR